MSDKINPQKGDVLWADRMATGLPYFHCGIYAGAGRVIHFAPEEGAEISAKNAFVHETDYDFFAADCPVRIIEYPQGFSADETLRRARSRIGEKGYDLPTNNCEHFAAWCKTGEHKSTQVDNVKKVVKVICGTAGEILCTIHDAVENYKAQVLTERGQVLEIEESADANSELSDTMPLGEAPQIEDAPQIFDADDIKYIEDKSVPEDAPPDVHDENIQEDAQDEDVQDEDAPSKKSKIDVVADKLKGITYAVAGALEFVKTKLPGPLRLIPFKSIALIAANVIDKVATVLKVITGRITISQAREEMQNAGTALLGETVAQKHSSPIREVVKTVFGPVGVAIGGIVKKAVTAFVPPKIRTAISTGFKRVTQGIVSGIKAGVSKIGSAIKNFGGKIWGGLKSLFGGKK